MENKISQKEFPKSPSQKSRRTGQGRKSKFSGGPKWLNWVFAPRLSNEKIILNTILDKYPVEYYSTIIDTIRNLITSLVQNHGFTDGPRRYNVIKQYTIQLVEGRNPENPPWLATSESFKVPSALGIEFIQLIIDSLENTDETLSPKYYQVIISILNINRMVDGLSTPDFESVEEKASTIDAELSSEFETYVSDKLKSFSFDKTNVNLFREHFNLRKNGPNEKPKIESAEDEAVALLSGKLYKPFRSLCDEIGVSYLTQYLEDLVDRLRSQDNSSTAVKDQVKKQIHLRKVVKVPDSGFKTRIVAIADFWTQLALLPVRRFVQEVIERLYSRTDFRKSHDDGVAAMVEFQKMCLEAQTINGVTLDSKCLKFYDIKSWTDRFHRDLQKIVMKHLISPRFSEMWSQLVVHCEWYSPDLKRTVKYGQGQGMGTNGSFDIATLTDHLFINFLIDKKSSISGIFQNNACYGKVGDDLWIYDPDGLIPIYYEKINLPINYDKSKVHCKLGSIAEFCSRTFVNSIDSSRISPKIINKSYDFRYMPTLLALCSQRGIHLDATSFPRLYNTVKSGKETYLDKLQPWIISLLVIGQYERSSYFSKLNRDYLENGNWVTGGPLRTLLDDPEAISRVLIGYSIVSLLDSIDDVNVKTFELVGARKEYSWFVSMLEESDMNAYDKNNIKWQDFMSTCPQDKFLSGLARPKQIITLARFADQRSLIRRIHTEIGVEESKGPEELLNKVKEISQLASRSCYDGGLIRYDTKVVYLTSLKIVKILECFNEDFSVLTLRGTTYGITETFENLSELTRLFKGRPMQVTIT